MHYKSYDGNVTDDKTHFELWQSIRSIVGKSDFLYVADCKLCVSAVLVKINKEQGRFVTILPCSRKEYEEFGDDVYNSQVLWDIVCTKKSSRTKKRADVFEHAQGLYQMREGFRIHWYRSSEKKLRDAQDREDRLEVARNKLEALNTTKRRGAKSIYSMQRSAQKILERYNVVKLLNITVSVNEEESYIRSKKLNPTADKETLYRKIVKKTPHVIVTSNIEGLDHAKAMDGVFPLVTNTTLSAIEVLDAYKYQPTLEKRHSLLKSGLEVAPVFLKKNTRIEAIMLVYLIAQMIAALIERSVRKSMKDKNIPLIDILPENRGSKSPSAQQIIAIFYGLSRSILTQNS